MKEINFRIIELQTHQVLLTKDFDQDDESKVLITVTFFLEGAKVIQKLGYSEEETRNEIFDKFTDAQAQTMLDNTLEMFNQE